MSNIKRALRDVYSARVKKCRTGRTVKPRELQNDIQDSLEQNSAIVSPLSPSLDNLRSGSDSHLPQRNIFASAHPVAMNSLALGSRASFSAADDAAVEQDNSQIAQSSTPQKTEADRIGLGDASLIAEDAAVEQDTSQDAQASKA